MKYESTPEAKDLQQELLEREISCSQVYQANDQLHAFIQNAADLARLPSRFAFMEVVPRVTGGPYGAIKHRGANDADAR